MFPHNMYCAPVTNSAPGRSHFCCSGSSCTTSCYSVLRRHFHQKEFSECTLTKMKNALPSKNDASIRALKKFLLMILLDSCLDKKACPWIPSSSKKGKEGSLPPRIPSSSYPSRDLTLKNLVFPLSTLNCQEKCWLACGCCEIASCAAADVRLVLILVLLNLLNNMKKKSLRQTSVLVR